MVQLMSENIQVLSKSIIYAPEHTTWWQQIPFGVRTKNSVTSTNNNFLLLLQTFVHS